MSKTAIVSLVKVEATQWIFIRTRGSLLRPMGVTVRMILEINIES